MVEESRRRLTAVVHGDKRYEEADRCPMVARVAFFYADRQGRFTWVDDAACELLGYTREELLHLTIRDTYVPDEIYLSERRIRDIKEGKRLRFRREARRKDASRVPVEVRARMLPDGRFHAEVRELGEGESL